jgi:CubicO group peptidase (beta-lactamase class C family)
MFDREAAYQHLSGVVLVAKLDGETIFEGCYGAANEKESNTLDTRFDIGSITKQFTAAAILQLVGTNQIKLDGFINDYLGDYASKSWKKVTVHQLLTHTSGIPSVYQTEQGLEIFLPEQTTISLKDLIAKFKDGRLLFSPGEEFSYSNSGYILLAAIIENISGQPYSQYLDNNIFKKYGLISTSYSSNQPNTALPYYNYRQDLLKTAPIYHPSWFVGAGGIYSTANDLAKWIQIISSNEFLSAELRIEFFKKHVKAGKNFYGYGWQLTAGGLIEHDGGNAGFISFLIFDPKTKEYIIILSNRSFEDIHWMGKSSDKVRDWATSIWKSLRGSKIDLLPSFQRRVLLCESFEIENGATITLTPNDSILLVKVSGGSPSRIIPSTILSGRTEEEKKLLEIGRLLGKGKYWGLAKYCDGEMSFVCYSGLMAIGFNTLKKKVGGLELLVPYKVDSKQGLLRMKGLNGILDIIVYFDDQGEVKGIFEHGFYALDAPAEMIAYPIENKAFFLDGFPYGEHSAILRFRNKDLEIEQFDRVLTAKFK